jgi:hypothetical protein
LKSPFQFNKGGKKQKMEMELSKSTTNLNLDYTITWCEFAAAHKLTIIQKSIKYKKVRKKIMTRSKTSGINKKQLCILASLLLYK